MAIYSCNNLLGCQTLLDWAQVKSELPQLFSGKEIANIQHKNLILYFAMQKIAPFHVCIVTYKEQYMLIHGEEELRILLDFVLCGTSLEKCQWTILQPFPGRERLTFSDLPLSCKERMLATKIPHCDFSVSTGWELELLQSYYSAAALSSIAFPIL